MATVAVICVAFSPGIWVWNSEFQYQRTSTVMSTEPTGNIWTMNIHLYLSCFMPYTTYEQTLELTLNQAAISLWHWEVITILFLSILCRHLLLRLTSHGYFVVPVNNHLYYMLAWCNTMAGTEPKLRWQNNSIYSWWFILSVAVSLALMIWLNSCKTYIRGRVHSNLWQLFSLL